MVTITNTTVTREQVWTAFRRTPDGRVRERYHAILLLMDGKSCPEAARWLYRDEETIHTWVHALNEAGLHGLERAGISLASAASPPLEGEPRGASGLSRRAGGAAGRVA
jgi:hypothetical protein